MGKKNQKTNKAGYREINPTDAFRKYQRNKEKKKNKLERRRVREESALRRNPLRVKEELNKLRLLELRGDLDKLGRRKREKLESMWEVIRKKLDVSPDLENPNAEKMNTRPARFGTELEDSNEKPHIFPGDYFDSSEVNHLQSKNKTNFALSEADKEKNKTTSEGENNTANDSESNEHGASSASSSFSNSSEEGSSSESEDEEVRRTRKRSACGVSSSGVVSSSSGCSSNTTSSYSGNSNDLDFEPPLPPLPTDITQFINIKNTNMFSSMNNIINHANNNINCISNNNTSPDNMTMIGNFINCVPPPPPPFIPSLMLNNIHGNSYNNNNNILCAKTPFVVSSASLHQSHMSSMLSAPHINTCYNNEKCQRGVQPIIMTPPIGVEEEKMKTSTKSPVVIEKKFEVNFHSNHSSSPSNLGCSEKPVVKNAATALFIPTQLMIQKEDSSSNRNRKISSINQVTSLSTGLNRTNKTYAPTGSSFSLFSFSSSAEKKNAHHGSVHTSFSISNFFKEPLHVNKCNDTKNQKSNVDIDQAFNQFLKEVEEV